MFEAFVAGLLLLMGGIFIGSKSAAPKLDEVVTPSVPPLEWAPREHRKIMYQCKMLCGENRVRSYDPLTGKCDCINDK